MRVPFITLLAAASLIAACGKKEVVSNVPVVDLRKVTQEQITFANEKRMCYAPIVFSHTPTQDEYRTVVEVAVGQGWKAVALHGQVIDLEKSGCQNR